MKVALIFNPRSGRGRHKTVLLPDAVACLEGANMEVTPMPTEETGHATVLAREASQKGFARVIAWGGDGTLNEVVSGLIETETAMGVLPGGTVNVFAREMRIPRNIRGAVEVIASGAVHRIPVGVAGERPFLLMAGAGLDGEVVYRLKAGFKAALGAWAFWVDGIKSLARYPMTRVRVRANGDTITGTAVVAGNIRRYGPSYMMTPDAVLEEPKLHVVVLQGRRKRDYVRYLAGVVGRFHLSYQDVFDLKTDRLEIELVDEDGSRVPIQLDGEPAGFVPVKITVRDKALSVILPTM